MTMFAWMFTGHFIGDFLLQTNWMAKNKAGNLPALFVHAGIYTAAVSLLALFAGGLRLHSIALLFVTHAVLDSRRLTRWWCKHITKSDEIPWLMVAADQSWHMVCLAAACGLSGL